MEHTVLEFSIVVVGNINASKIQPNWLAKKGLIPIEEVIDSKIEILSNRITKFSISDSLQFEITNKRCIIKTKSDAVHEVIKDLVVGIFSILNDYDLKHIGINHIYHYELSDTQYMNIGDIYAPFKNWESIFDNPRMLNLEMVQEKRSDDFNGYQRVSLQPSELVDTGAVVSINDHYSATKDSTGTADIISILNEVWNSSKKNATSTSTQLMDKV